MTDSEIIKQIENRKQEEERFAMAWYDPKIKGYRFYLSSGEEIPFGIDGSVCIEDNWGKPYPASYHRATISFLVRVVNDKPNIK